MPDSDYHDLHLRGDNPWTTRARRVLYDNGRIRLREDDVLAPDGSDAQYSFLELCGPVVAMVPIDEQRRVHLVRQWRYPWDRNSWEVPSGHCEPGEDPLEAARRELAEEVGLRADCLEPLAVVQGSATIRGLFHVYLAQDLTPVEIAGRDATEHDLEVHAVPFDRAIQAVMDNTIVHAVSIASILLAARRLGA